MKVFTAVALLVCSQVALGADKQQCDKYFKDKSRRSLGSLASSLSDAVSQHSGRSLAASTACPDKKPKVNTGDKFKCAAAECQNEKADQDTCCKAGAFSRSMMFPLAALALW